MEDNQTARRIALPTGGTLEIRPTLARTPFGRRGERPCTFHLAYDRAQDIKWFGIPGVLGEGSKVHCTFDGAVAVAMRLGEDPNIVPIPWKVVPEMPGRARYLELGLDKTLYPPQRDMALFLCQHAYAWNDDAMGCGKTPTTVAASILCGSQKTLVIPPAFVTREWAKQIARFAQEEAIVLEGRGQREARIFCLKCAGRGRLPNPDDGNALTIKCDACLRRGRANGYKTVYVEDLRPVYEEHTTDDGVRYAPYPAATYSCKMHPNVVEASPGLCPACQDDLHDAIAAAKYVIVNPELLMAHRSSDGRGRGYFRQDLPGWSGVIARFHFDLAIRDEGHQDRGYPLGGTEKTHETRRDRIDELLQPIERVWYVTGTPMFGFVRDYWSQLDIMSKGLWSADWCPDAPFAFARAYCDAKRNEFNGYIWDGTGERAKTELVSRLRVLKMGRPRSVIAPFMPKKTREVVWVDSTGEEKPIKLSRKDRSSREAKEGAILKLQAKAGAAKTPVIIERMIAHVSEGNKVFIFVKHHDSVERYAKAFSKAATSREYATRWRQVNGEIWAVHGGQTKDARLNMGEAFQEHDGAAVFISTIDAFQVGVRLNSKHPDTHPVTAIGFAEFHHSVQAMRQAEARPEVPGAPPIMVYYFIARGTIDDRYERQIIPRIEAADAVAKDEEAKGMLAAFEPETPETLDEILNRLTEGIDDELEDTDDD